MAHRKFIFQVSLTGTTLVFSLIGQDGVPPFTSDALPAACLPERSFIVIKRAKQTITGALIAKNTPLVLKTLAFTMMHFSPSVPELAFTATPQSMLLPEHFHSGDAVEVNITDEKWKFEEQFGFPERIPDNAFIPLREKYITA
jgi:hypothetical protein